MTNKTNKTNKTKLVVNWPKNEHFTIKSLSEKFNPGAKEITLRVRLNKELEKKAITVIGSLKGSSGRPQNVFAFTPVAKEILEAAKNEGVNIEYSQNSTVTVASINSQNQVQTETNKNLINNLLKRTEKV